MKCWHVYRLGLYIGWVQAESAKQAQEEANRKYGTDAFGVPYQVEIWE